MKKKNYDVTKCERYTIRIRNLTLIDQFRNIIVKIMRD